MEPSHVLKLVGGKQWMLQVKHFCYNIHSTLSFVVYLAKTVLAHIFLL